MKLYGQVVKQFNHTFYSVVMSAEQVVRLTKFDRFSMADRGGSQRNVIESNLVDYKNYVERQNPSPRALLLNLRPPDTFTISRLAKGQESGLVKIEIPDNAALYCFDGQHFVLVQTALLKSGLIVGNFQTAALLSNMTREEEMLQFFVVNNTAKTVDRAIGQQQVASYAGGGTDKMVKLLDRLPPSLSKGVTWRVSAVKIVNTMMENPVSMWYKNIKLAGMDSVKKQKQKFPLQQQSVIRSLEPVAKDLIHVGEETIMSMLDALWLGVYSLWPEPFLNPKDYLLFGVTGFTVLHKMLPNIYREWAMNNKPALNDPNAYAAYFRNSGWTSEEWKKGKVSHANCWASYSIYYDLLNQAIAAGRSKALAAAVAL